MWAPPCKKVHLVLILSLTYSHCTFGVLLRNGMQVTHGNHSFAFSRHYLSIKKQESSIHTWEQHNSTVPPCNSQSMKELTTGKWYITRKGHYMFEPDTCMLRRITGESARRYGVTCVQCSCNYLYVLSIKRDTVCWRRCFSGKHIAFVGDSLMRYQYINLAYFLSKLERMEPYGDQRGRPSLCIETEWKDWEQYYHFTSAILGSSVEGCGTEICDCSRNSDTTLDKIREYRTLHLYFPDSCKESYINHIKVQDLDYLSVSYQQTFRHPDPLRAGQDALRLYEHSYRQQPPDVLILNMGLHISDDPEYNSTLTSVLDLAKSLSSVHNITLLWKTTTYGTGSKWPLRDSELDLVLTRNVSVYDVGKMVSAAVEQRLAMTWDPLHFFPFVYEQMNDVLLNSLCKS